MKKVIVIGGGISGLTTTYLLDNAAADIDITLIERDKRLGGKIVTEHIDEFVIEGGPDCFLSSKPRGIALCEMLGITGRLQGRKPEHATTYIRANGLLHRLPEGLSGAIPTNLKALEKSSLLSAEGRSRLVQDLDIPPSPDSGDESIAAFISRRLGREVYERIVEPLMSGIYAGDGEQLSLAATFPHLRQLELNHGGLVKGLKLKGMNGQSRSKYPPFVAFRSGMGELVGQLAARLTRTTILAGTGVNEVRVNRADNGYTLILDDGSRVTANSIIITTPAYATARMVAALDPSLAEAHSSIPYSSCATISLAYADSDLPSRPDGYGYLIPRTEGTDVLACSIASNKWRGRAPQGYTLVRAYLGRYGREDVLKKSDEELLDCARKELEQSLRITALPNFYRIYRWPEGMPQYTIGHIDRLARIETRLRKHQGLFVAGATYRGVGIPDCIQSAEQAVEDALSYLHRQ